MSNFLRFSTIAAAFGLVAASYAQMDQITGQTTGPVGFASQDFEPVNDAFDIAAIDDFTLSVGSIINGVDADVVGFGGFTTFANVTAWRVEIYSSVAAGAANLTGDIGSQTVAAGSTTMPGGTSGIVTIPVNILVNAPGTYWLGVIPVLNFTPGGQLGVKQSTGGTPAGTNAFQVNPGGGFGFGTSQQILVSGAPQNLAYRMRSTPVPEPATLAVLGLGALGLVRRRRNR